jgi:hypothetical protein
VCCVNNQILQFETAAKEREDKQQQTKNKTNNE